MKTQIGPFEVHHKQDIFDSANDALVIREKEEREDGRRGGITVARINVAPFAPHLDEPLAIANLFASAPELLEALEALLKLRAITHVEEIAQSTPHSLIVKAKRERDLNAVAAARAAIAKAKGETK